MTQGDTCRDQSLLKVVGCFLLSMATRVHFTKLVVLAHGMCVYNIENPIQMYFHKIKMFSCGDKICEHYTK